MRLITTMPGNIVDDDKDDESDGEGDDDAESTSGPLSQLAFS